jgi:lysozyme family protein
MTIENQKSDLEHLSRTWHEKVKNIRAMAKRCKESDTEYSPEVLASENTTEVPSDNELFAAPVHEELSAQQLFAGNEDFYKSLESAQFTGTQQSFDAGRVSTAQIGYKRFSSVQKALAAAIVLIAAVLLYAILKPPSEPASQMVSADRQTPAGTHT